MGWGKPKEEAPVSAPRKAVKFDATQRDDVVTLDFETYYAKDYSLRSLSYTEYIRDPRFEAIICAVKVGKGPTIVLKDRKSMERRFKQIDWSKTDMLCHNTPFDGFIMAEKFGVVPRRYFDTLSMARGLHGNDIRGDLDTVSRFYGGSGKRQDVLPNASGMTGAQLKASDFWEKYCEYCANDVDQTYMIFHKMLAVMPPLELEKIDIFIRAFCEPKLYVDRPRVEKELTRELAEKEQKLLAAVGTKVEQTKLILLLGKSGAIEHAKKMLGSGPQFAELLEDLGVKPPMKPSPTNPHRLTYAFSQTDEEFLQLLEHRDPQVRNLVEARLAVKSTGNEAKAARFLKVSENDGKLPVLINYYAAHTGRPGGGNKMNMLNLERDGELRRSILAPPGHKVCVADSGQIEARAAMWISGQHDALEEFRLYDQGKGRDPYSIFADDIFGYTIDKKLHPHERFIGKVGKLSLQYQAGAPRFQTMLALGALGGPPVFMELDECQRIVSLFRRKHDKIVKAWAKCADIIRDMARGRTGTWGVLSWEKERIWLPNGMALKYPGLVEHHPEEGNTNWTYLRKEVRSKIYGGLLFENISQALANVIVTEQMVEINRKYPIVTMTYDENVWIAKTKEAKKSFEFGLKVMQTPPSWCPDFPLAAEGGFADNYSK